jgi:hypothetical protein
MRFSLSAVTTCVPQKDIGCYATSKDIGPLFCFIVLLLTSLITMKFTSLFVLLAVLQQQCPVVQGMAWNRIATFLTCTQDDLDCNLSDSTVAEIVSVTSDGLTLVYTDSPGERIGFVDISDPSNPQPDGVVLVDGEPTSVTVTDEYVLYV